MGFRSLFHSLQLTADLTNPERTLHRHSNISNDLTIIGDVSSWGSVTLDGDIEGNIYCTSLIVTANGSVNGEIIANQEVVVQGMVKGTIHARRVMLQSSAKVEGDIFTRESASRWAPATTARFAGPKMNTTFDRAGRLPTPKKPGGDYHNG